MLNVETQPLKKRGSGQRDSNPRPRAWEARTLPLSYVRSLLDSVLSVIKLICSLYLCQCISKAPYSLLVELGIRSIFRIAVIAFHNLFSFSNKYSSPIFLSNCMYLGSDLRGSKGGGTVT